jgi:hypothetical protein
MYTHRKAYEWFRKLPRWRKLGVLLGISLYFASFEYIHDFGVKHPVVAFAAVLTMILAGSEGHQACLASQATTQMPPRYAATGHSSAAA